MFHEYLRLDTQPARIIQFKFGFKTILACVQHQLKIAKSG